MTATWSGALIAESENVVTLEGNAYFPADALDPTRVEPSSHITVCPWKGTAHYLDVVVDGQRNANAAWFYPEPKPAAAEIAGRVAFWKGVRVAETP